MAIVDLFSPWTTLLRPEQIAAHPEQLLRSSCFGAICSYEHGAISEQTAHATQPCLRFYDCKVREPVSESAV